MSVYGYLFAIYGSLRHLLFRVAIMQIKVGKGKSPCE